MFNLLLMNSLAALGRYCKDGLLSIFNGKTDSDNTKYIAKPGQDREHFKARGFEFTGSDYVDYSSNMTIVGDFNFSFWQKSPATSFNKSFLANVGGSFDRFLILSSRTIRVYIGGIAYNLPTYVLPDGDAVFLRFRRVGALLTLTAGGVDYSVAISTNNMTMRRLCEGLDVQIWDIDFEDSEGKKLITPGVTGDGDTVENLADEDNPGTIVNRTASTWAEFTDGSGSNRINSAGYTLADGTTMYTTSAATTLYTAGGLIPARLDSTTECVAFDSSGAFIPLQYSGAAAVPLEIVAGPVFVGDGVVTGFNASNAGATIVSQSSTGTATIDGAGVISFPVGNYYIVTLSNGSTYSMTEGTDTKTALTIYDRHANGHHLTLSNVSASNWDILARPYGYPLEDGYTTVALGFIPSRLSDPTLDALGNAIEVPAGKTFVASNPNVFSAVYDKTWINAESAALITIFFDGIGGRNELTWADMVANYNDMYFYQSPNKFLVYYDGPITDDCLNKTLLFVGEPGLDYVTFDGEFLTFDGLKTYFR